MKGTTIKRLAAVILAGVMLLSLLPVSAFAAEQERFALLVITEDRAVIAPTYIAYGQDDTLAQALEKSGYAFDGLDAGYITAVEGAADNYSVYYDGGAYDLTAPAKGVSALYLTTNADHVFGSEFLELVKCMADYNAADDGLQDYAQAQKAYDNALRGFYHATAAKAETLKTALQTQMDAYSSYKTGEKVSVALSVTRSGASVTPAQVTLTGAFGNTVTVENSKTIWAVPGEYTFDVYDGGNGHVRGSIKVSEGAVLKAELPDAQWLDRIDLSIDSGDNWAAVERADGKYLVPDYAGASLYPYIVPAGGISTSDYSVYITGQSTKRSWRSHNTVLTNVLQPNSLQGAEPVLEVRHSVGDYEQYETYALDIERVPSLQALSVSSEGTQLLTNFAADTDTYELTTVSDTVSVTPAALCEDSACYVNGQLVHSGTAIDVSLSACPLNGTARSLLVTVHSDSGVARDYTLHIRQETAVTVTLKHAVDAVVVDSSGAEVAPIAEESGQTIYRLIPNMSYSYITTAEEYYHTTATFKATDGLCVTAQMPDTEDHLLSMGAAAKRTGVLPYLETTKFSAVQHAYHAIADANNGGFYLQATAADGYTVKACYQGHPSDRYAQKKYEKELTTTSFTALDSFWTESALGNTVTVQVSQQQDGVTYYQDYILQVQRRLTINKLLAATDLTSLKLQRSDGTYGYDKTVADYTVNVGEKTPKITVQWSNNITEPDFAITVACGTWQSVWRSEEADDAKAMQSVSVPLDAECMQETITLTTSYADAVPQTYTIAVNKSSALTAHITVNPADATVFLMSSNDHKRVLCNDEGDYVLEVGMPYCCTVTKNGYIGQEISFVAGQDSANLSVTLQQAQESSRIDMEKDGDWTNFRADAANNGVIGAKTPVTAEDAVLTWAKKVGDGYGSGATGCPIIVDGYLYTYAGHSIVKMDRHTGEIVATGAMADSSSFAINSPTYAEGMIFVGLSNGQVQAFDAATLQSLWLYTDPLSGQPNCPITYHDGYIYTGFWNSEVRSANFVCLSVTDEDPTRTTEPKLATWTHEDAGFYWAGAYACDDFVLVTTDDGAAGYTTGYGAILSLDPASGTVLDRKVMPNVGDLRSSVCYDTQTDAYYFTSKGGDFYRIKVNADGTFVSGSLRRLHLDNGANSASAPPMSTSTPVIYKGRAYVGVCGTDQFGPYSGHNITVIDLVNWCIAYAVPAQGYPQTSGLLTTAYENGRECVYVYFFDNYTPGKLRVIRDSAGQTEVDHSYTTMETYRKNGQDVTVETAYVLFTPSGDQAQYAICSPVADSDGNIYFKNDSAQMMCLSSRIVSLQVTRKPNKLTYREGECFDAAGMKVTATYANGLQRDVTDYITYTTKPLTVNDTEIRLRYRLGENQTMYQDQNGRSGVSYTVPSTALTVTVQHTQKTAVTKATLSKNGKIVYKCSVCGEPTKSAKTIYMPKTFTLSSTSYTYDGKVKKPTVTVKDSKGKVLKKDIDYTVTYASGRKAVGEYKVTVKGIGNYNFTKILTFKINPAATKIVSAANVSTKSIKVKWNKVTGVTGYQVMYKVGSTEKTVKVAKASTVSKTISKLKKGKIYKVKVRTYKTVSGKNYYSAWSVYKSVTVAK